ncbi:sensor histidine kinase [Streptomyces sp. SPB074]|uniref:sensor histidine kinase n=1 Tax=Streptomyces sp. (strain SPB074) TaxID=465543 RepID=UPI00017F13BA|nr:histidine kinase [Streptomyces sp. SPB074]EDY42554.2 conserved hypothetical protein [Streptomyces sp. SPB074]
MSGSALRDGARAHREDAGRGHLGTGTTALTLAVLAAFLGIGVLYLMEARTSPPVLALGIASLLLVCGLQLAHLFPRLPLWTARRRHCAFGAQVLLAYLPFLLSAGAPLATPGFLAASALLVIASPWRWLVFSAIVASGSLVVPRTGMEPGSLLHGTVVTALTGLVVFGFSELARLLREAQRTRGELARTVLEAERQRFSRDLHDLLGISLTTIAYKCEVARRLGPGQHVRRHEVLTEIMDSTQRAFDDVRAASQAYRALSLAAEIDAVRATLRDMDVRVTFRGSAGVLPPSVETTLATVLREGVTNLLRHSQVTTCVVKLSREGDTALLVLRNDGVVRRPAAAGGSGLENLRERVEAVHGELRAEAEDDDWFRLEAVVPVPAGSGAAPAGAFRPALLPASGGRGESASVA